MNDKEIERMAEEVSDPTEAQATIQASDQPTDQADVQVAPGEDEGEDIGVVIIQDPDTGQIFLAQELTAEDLVDMGIEISEEEGPEEG